MDLVGFVLDEKLRPLAPAKLAAMQLEPEEADDVLDRLAAALHHPSVMAVLSPSPTKKL
jgi:hypothetical protein